MKISQVKTILGNLEEVAFRLPSGQKVPDHFHVTEVGKITKDYVDCGGTLRHEVLVGFQLWTATDTDHRLKASKLLSIIDICEKRLQLPDAEVEVEFQGTTIEKYSLAFDGSAFVLMPKYTDCLAKDSCGVPPAQKQSRPLSELSEPQVQCSPGSGCC